jgi:hypothetical protein
MKIQSQLAVTTQDVAKILEAGLAQKYTLEVKKNPLLRFEYIQVRKSAFVGAWVRVKKDNSITIDGAVPSPLARGLLGGLLLMLVTQVRTREITNDISILLQEHLR